MWRMISEISQPGERNGFEVWSGSDYFWVNRLWLNWVNMENSISEWLLINLCDKGEAVHLNPIWWLFGHSRCDEIKSCTSRSSSHSFPWFLFSCCILRNLMVVSYNPFTFYSWLCNGFWISKPGSFNSIFIFRQWMKLQGDKFYI